MLNFKDWLVIKEAAPVAGQPVAGQPAAAVPYKQTGQPPTNPKISSNQTNNQENPQVVAARIAQQRKELEEMRRKLTDAANAAKKLGSTLGTTGAT
jgi:hypothetical protein